MSRELFPGPGVVRGKNKVLVEQPEMEDLGTKLAIQERAMAAPATTDDLLTILNKSRLLETVDFDMFGIGCMATRAALRHLRHEALPNKVMVPAEVIDKTNYKARLIPVEQRKCPEWNKVVARAASPLRAAGPARSVAR